MEKSVQNDDDQIERLRAELNKLTGAVRIGPLTTLGQLLANRYWRAGLGLEAQSRRQPRS